MCPQLLSRVKPDATTVFGPGCLAERPQLSVYVANVIAIWSYTDTAYASMLTHFLKADFRVVHEMFHALRSTDARRQMLQSAAEEVLQDEDLDMFNAVKKCTNASRLKRNDFAHCLWGTSDKLPNALLQASPRYSTEYDVYMALALSGTMQGEKQKELHKFAKEHESIYVYRKNDLEREVAEAIWACDQINCLLQCFSLPLAEGREQARTELLAEPRIQACIASLSPEIN